MGKGIGAKIATACGLILVIAAGICTFLFLGSIGRATGCERAPVAERADDRQGWASEAGVDWDYWKSVNPDVIGWVSVPGTKIDCPIVQAPADDPDYYLTHDVYGKWNILGCPYLDADCADGGLLDSENAVVFGHNFWGAPDDIFAPFANYSNASWAGSHRKIVVLTPEGDLGLTFCGADVIGGWERTKRTSFDGESDFRAYAANMLDACDIALAEPEELYGGMFTFVTCSYIFNSDDERTLVYACRP